MKYREDIAIDKDCLDIEWLQQADKYMKYLKMAVFAESKKLKAKVGLDVLEATLDGEVREELLDEGKKATEAIVKNLVTRHPKRVKAVHELIEITEEYNLLASAVRAFEQRKKALEKLVELHNAGYFGQPKSKTPVTHDTIQDRQRDKLKARRTE